MSRKSISISVAITSTVKAPAGQLRDFVLYHLKNGIDAIYLFFDDPQDESIRLFKNEPRVKTVVCDDMYWSHFTTGSFANLDTSILINRQRINATNALTASRGDGIDWLTHIDSDELIYPIPALKRYLNRTYFKSIRFTVLEAIPNALISPMYFRGITRFKRPATLHCPTFIRYPWNSIKLFIAKAAGCKNLFEINEDYFRGHVKSKVCFRTNVPVNEVRIHQTHFSRRTWTHRSKRILLLHFEGVDYLRWIDKWKDRTKNLDIRNAYRPTTYRFFQRIKAISASLEADDEFIDLYKKTNFIKEKEWTILKLLGLIEEIDSTELFPEI